MSYCILVSFLIKIGDASDFVRLSVVLKLLKLDDELKRTFLIRAV